MTKGLVHIPAHNLCIFQHLPYAYLPLLLQNDSWLFCLIKDFSTKWRLGSFIQNILKKHLLQNDRMGVCYKIHFTTPFLSKIRPGFWFVVCMGPPWSTHNVVKIHREMMHLVLIFLPISRHSPPAKIMRHTNIMKYLGIFPRTVKVPNEGR